MSTTAIKVIKFETRETPMGCTVTRIGPKHTRAKRFRNGYAHSTISAKQWIAEDINCILEAVRIDGLSMPEIYVNGELVTCSMTSECKTISEPSDWWHAFGAQAEAEGLSLSAWLGEAAKAKLPPNVAKKLTERPAGSGLAKAKD